MSPKKTINWLISAATLFLTLATLTSAQTTPASNPSGSFTSAGCMFTVPVTETEGDTIECGYLTVPAQHADPTGPTIRLAVAILKSTSNTPAPDPVVMAQGGPGGSTLETYAKQAAFLTEPFRATRDVILFDQRGTLYSEPNLYCYEIDELVIDTIEQSLTLEESLALEVEAMLACRQRLVREGINLAAYNSLENAADVAALRTALGYEQINFYGVSYGTLLGLHLMQHYPAGLRSVILDAVVPRQTNFLTESPRSADRAFSELFAACAADSDCQANYPDLEQTFFELVDRLNEESATVPLTDPASGQTYQAVLTGDILVGLLFQFLYPSEFIPLLPKMITDVQAGDYTLLTFTWPLIAFDRTFSIGMYHSVLCAEDADFEISDMAVEGIRPALAKDIQTEYEAFLGLCALWNVPPLGPTADEPVVSDIPTLLLSGQLDPITPPSFAFVAAQTLSRSYQFTFQTNGHSVLSNPCADQIIQDFLSQPTDAPTATCLADQPPRPVFITPANTLMIGLFPALLQFSTTAWLEVGLSFLCVGVLLSAWLIWPVVIVVQWLSRSQPEETSPSASVIPALSRWLAILVGFVSSLFLGGLVAAVLYVSLEEEIIILVGLPAYLTPLFWLPPFLAFLIIGMLLATLLAWLQGYWSIFGRLYYTLLTMAALFFAGILLKWGFMTLLFM